MGRSPVSSKRIRAGEVREFRIEGPDPVVEGMPFVPHILDQHPHPTADRRLFGEKLFQPKLKPAPPLGEHDAPLKQDRPKLVDQSRALSDKPISGPVQALHVELLVAL